MECVAYFSLGSSSGLGHRPLTAGTGVRLPYRVPKPKAHPVKDGPLVSFDQEVGESKGMAEPREVKSSPVDCFLVPRAGGGTAPVPPGLPYRVPGNGSVIETMKKSSPSGLIHVLGVIPPARNDMLLAFGYAPGGNLNPPEPPSRKMNPLRRFAPPYAHLAGGCIPDNEKLVDMFPETGLSFYGIVVTPTDVPSSN